MEKVILSQSDKRVRFSAYCVPGIVAAKYTPMNLLYDVAKYYNMEVPTMLQWSKEEVFSAPRRNCQYLMRHFFPTLSDREIGVYVKRKRGAVLNNVNKVKGYIFSRDPKTIIDIANLTDLISKHIDAINQQKQAAPSNNGGAEI